MQHPQLQRSAHFRERKVNELKKIPGLIPNKSFGFHLMPELLFDAWNLVLSASIR